MDSNLKVELKRFVEEAREFYDGKHKGQVSSKELGHLEPHTAYGKHCDSKHGNKQLTDKEYARLVAGIEHPVVRLIVEVIWHVKMRAFEVLHLSIQDVDIQGGSIRIPNTNRYTYIPLALQDKLVTYRDTCRVDAQPYDPFFVISSVPVKYRLLRSEVTKAAEHVGLGLWKDSLLVPRMCCTQFPESFVYYTVKSKDKGQGENKRGESQCGTGTCYGSSGAGKG